MIDEIRKLIESLALSMYLSILDSDVGINTKVGINTLKDSSLKENSTVSSNMSGDDLLVSIITPYYLDYINSGLKKGVYVPINVIINWCSKKNISTDNNVVYAIQKSIYNVGIPPRPIKSTFYDNLSNYWSSWSEEIFKLIIQELKK